MLLEHFKQQRMAHLTLSQAQIEAEILALRGEIDALAVRLNQAIRAKSALAVEIGRLDAEPVIRGVAA